MTLRLTPPKGICFKEELDNEYEFSYSMLRERLHILLQLHYSSLSFGIADTSNINVEFAPDSFFNIPKLNQKKLEKIRFCELQCPNDPSIFIPAAIIRSHKHLVWIHLEAEDRITFPRIYSIV